VVDINDIRDPDIRLYCLKGADRVYTIYYDETNNIRRLLLTERGLNIETPHCFALGGVAHHGQPYDLGLSELRARLRLQPTVKEIKLEHLGKGDFPALLRSEKISTFLEWLAERDLYVHFQVLDPIYWSTVDIIDSILAESQPSVMVAFAAELKDDLYTILREDLDDTIGMLIRFNYPDVGGERRVEFISALMERLIQSEHLLPDFNFQMLRGVLQTGAKLNSLPFLEDEKPNVLIDELSAFYAKRVCLFKYSTHFLDAEPWIRKHLESYHFTDRGKPFTNYEFVDSSETEGVQISDIVAGLLGKAFTYLNRNNLDELEVAASEFSEKQKRCLGLLVERLDRSIAENAAFAQFIVSGEDRRRGAYLLDL